MTSLLIFILSLSTLWAFDVSRENNHVILKADTCGEVKLLTDELAGWTADLGQKKSCSNNPSMNNSTRKCQLDITSCIPDLVAKYQGLSDHRGNALCFNAALVMKGILPGLRDATPEEMDFYMSSPLCRPVKNEESKKAGDVVAIRSYKEYVSDNCDPHVNQCPSVWKVVESHGFIYISDQISYSKNGPGSDIPYSLQSTDFVYSKYRVSTDAKCRLNQSVASEKCPQALSFYRCTSMQEYLDAHSDIPSQLKQAFQSFDQYERCYENWVLYPFNSDGTQLSREVVDKILPQQVVKNMVDSAAALAQYLEDEIKKKGDLGMKSEERSFVLATLQLRLQSIAEHSLNLVGDRHSYYPSEQQKISNLSDVIQADRQQFH